MALQRSAVRSRLAPPFIISKAGIFWPFLFIFLQNLLCARTLGIAFPRVGIDMNARHHLTPNWLLNFLIVRSSYVWFI